MTLLLLKKLVARLLFPAPLLFLLFAVGLALILWPGLGKRRRLAGKILLCAGTALFLFASLGGHWVLSTLTDRYSPLDLATLPDGKYTLAVAGSGFYSDSSLPPEHRFNDPMLLRLHEAGRIGRALEKRGLEYTVYASVVGAPPTAEKRLALEALLGQYGIPPERIGLCENALNSRQEVIAFSARPGRKILISEAFHMPRLMMLSKRYGLDAIPAPASRGSRHGGFAFYPSAERFDDCERAVYEYLGTFEYRLF